MDSSSFDLQTRSSRRDRDSFEFEQTFQKLAHSSKGEGAAVSAAWAWLAESAREERLERQRLRSGSEGGGGVG